MNQQASSVQCSDVSPDRRSLRSESPKSGLSYVVVIEDEYLIASDIKEAFDLAGVSRVELISDVAGALSLLTHESPEGAILDLNLRGEMAFLVADTLLYRKIPFVFMTGHDRSAIPRRFNHVTRCQKPIKPAHAVATLFRTVRDRVHH